MEESIQEIPKEIVLGEREAIEKVYGRTKISFIMSGILPGIIIGAVLICIMEVVLSVFIFLPLLSPIFAIFGVTPLALLPLAIALNIIVLSIYFGLIILAFFVAGPYTQSHRFILTNERIILYMKFIIILRRDLWYDKITDLTVLQGPFGRWKNYGAIQPITAGIEMGLAQFIHAFKGVANPYDLKKELMKIVNKYRHQ